MHDIIASPPPSALRLNLHIPYKSYFLFLFPLCLVLTTAYGRIRQVEQVLANQLPTILGAMLMGSHLLTFWVWLFLRIVETIEAHSGYGLARGVVLVPLAGRQLIARRRYSLPLSPFSLVPFMNGADVHDFHHSHNVDNYGAYMSHFTLSEEEVLALQPTDIGSPNNRSVVPAATGTFFMFWDWLMGTNRQYQQWRRDQKEKAG
jgi:hypothetical protein